MSIGVQIQGLPDTKQGFTSNASGTSQIVGIFVTENDFEFSSLSEVKDIESFYDAMEAENLTPLHLIQTFTAKDKESTITTSEQDFTYETNKATYRQEIKYDWSADYYELVKAISGSSKRIIYYDNSKNLHLTSEGGVYKGYKANRIILKDLLFPTASEPSLSILDIELKHLDSGERLEVVPVDWSPEEVDRLFVNIEVQYLDSATLNFTVKHLNLPVTTGIESTDVTLTDDISGDVTFSLFNINGGVYQLSGFSSAITTGLLTIIAPIYIGCVKYRVIITVPIESTFLLLDDDDFALLDDDGFNLLVNILEHPLYNAGYSPATDWLDIGGGLADGWIDVSSFGAVPTIITGSGFTGNAQRFETSNPGGDNLQLRSIQSITLDLSKTYTVKLKYRASNQLVVVFGTDSFSLPANTGAATLGEGDINPTSIVGDFKVVGVNFALGEYLEIDEVRYEEEI